ncbi:MAG: hypothetical protein JXA71_03645 [Chitinispirillaceae bacterium]|nr:hypothetical protein [Chitinispirillaceae bacterium]
MIKKTVLVIAVLISLLLSSCAALNFLGERLNVFLVNFSFSGIGVSLVTPPGLISLKLSDYGIAVNCRVTAKNDNATRAVFDGASFMLRVSDTSRAARGIQAPVPSFAVEPNSQTTITVPFRIMLDNQLFSKTVLSKVVYGDRIPYRVSADLLFNLLPVETGGTRGVPALGSRTMTLDLVSDAVDTRPDLGGLAGKAFMAALNLISGR